MIISTLLLLFGFFYNDIVFISLASLLFMFIGVDILIFGIERLINTAVIALGATFLGVGFVTIIRTYFFEYQDMGG